MWVFFFCFWCDVFCREKKQQLQKIFWNWTKINVNIGGMTNISHGWDYKESFSVKSGGFSERTISTSLLPLPPSAQWKWEINAILEARISNRVSWKHAQWWNACWPELFYDCDDEISPALLQQGDLRISNRSLCLPLCLILTSSTVNLAYLSSADLKLKHKILFVFFCLSVFFVVMIYKPSPLRSA